MDENGYHFISYAPCNRLIDTVYKFKDDTFSVLDLEGRETLYKHPKETGYYHPDFSNGIRLAFESESEVHIWSKGEKYATGLEHITGVYPSSLKFSQDSQTLIARMRSGIFKWDVTQPQDRPRVFKPLGIKLDFNGHQEERYFSVDVSSEGKQFITSGNENTLHLWEMDSDIPIATVSIQSEVDAAAFSPTADLIACRDNANQIYIWDATTGELQDTYTVDKNETYHDLVFSPDGAYLASRPCHLYDIVQHKQLDGFLDDHFQFQAFSPDSTHIWDTAYAGETIRLWNIDQYEEVLSLPKPSLKPYETKRVEAFALSDCGQYLACSLYSKQRNSRLFVWDIHKGQEPIVVFNVYNTDVNLAAFSPDHFLLASAGGDGTILLWDMKPF